MSDVNQPEEQLHVLIVGGSLAGLMAAHTLAEAGIRSTVFERADSHRPSGAALAVDDLQLVEVLGTVRAAAALGRQPQRYATVAPTSWAQLHRGLRDTAVKDDRITLRYNTPITSVGQDARQAWVTLAEGSTVSGDAVLGADGYRSVVRPEVDPQRPYSTFAGYALWLGIVEEADIPAQRNWPRSLDFRSAGGHYLLGYPLAAEDNDSGAGGRRLGWAWYDATRNGFLRSAGSVRGARVRHSLQSADIPSGTYAELAGEERRYWPAPWRDAILHSIKRRAVICTPISEYVPERLARGRVALVGDAAHVPTPMTGRGFATAVDDAAAIAFALRNTAVGDVSHALIAYQSARIELARELVLSGRAFSRGFAA